MTILQLLYILYSMTGIVILPDWLITTPEQPPKHGWGIYMEGSVISEVAPKNTLLQKYPQDEIWEAEDQVLSPGFVNAHTHLYGVLAHGIPLHRAPSGFWPFLEEFWWPLVEDRLSREMICAATALRCSDMLKSGVTSFYDCTEAPYALPGILAAQAAIVQAMGIRGILSFEATERVSKSNGLLGLEENVHFIKSSPKYSKMPSPLNEPNLVSGFMCFHTTFTCSAEFIKHAFDLAEELGASVHIHVSEGVYEPQVLLEKLNLRPFQYYDQLGVASPRMLASQCVQVDTDEIKIMKERGVRMAHMPLSNCEVGGGIAPVPALVDAGVTVGLGSDGYIEDFFEVMRGAFLIHKAAQQDPRLMPAPLVWKLATEGGAKALDLQNIGQIKQGWQADVQLIDISHLPTPPEDHNLLEQLVLYCDAIHVKAVWVAGNLRVRGGIVLGVDVDEQRARTREAAKKLWQ